MVYPDDVGHVLVAFRVGRSLVIMGFRPVVDALSRKYNSPDQRQYLPAANPDFDVLYVLRPVRALLWVLSKL
jgi:hypothetical protein